MTNENEDGAVVLVELKPMSEEPVLLTHPNSGNLVGQAVEQKDLMKIHSSPELAAELNQALAEVQHQRNLERERQLAASRELAKHD